MIPLVATMVAFYTIARLVESMHRERRSENPSGLLVVVCGIGIVGVVVCTALIYQQSSAIQDAMLPDGAAYDALPFDTMAAP